VKKTIDQENRKGGPYEPKPQVTEEKMIHSFGAHEGIPPHDWKRHSFGQCQSADGTKVEIDSLFSDDP
jgi:hypothetical protein